MTPKLAAYFGLTLSEEAEKLISSLDYKALFSLLYDVVFCAFNEDVDRFYWQGAHLTRWFDDEINDLSEADKINLIRYLGACLQIKLMEAAT